MPVDTEFIKLYDSKGVLEAYLENAYDIVEEATLQGAETLEFSIPLSDDKASLIQAEDEVIYNGKRYIITQVDDCRDEDGAKYKYVKCESAIIELNKRVKGGRFILSHMDVRQGLEKILENTNWTIGTVEYDPSATVYGIKEQGRSVLWLIYAWATITGLEVEFDTINRVVSLKKRVGVDRGATLRYGRNIRSMRRTYEPPQATVLYAYGQNMMSFSSINQGRAYVENYGWYTSQGYSLDEARAYFKKEVIIMDESFTSDVALLEYAQETLSQLAYPKLSYECSILDLSELTGLPEDRLQIGDTVHVFDEDLGIDVVTRVVRVKRYAGQPWMNEIELEFANPGLEALLDTTGVTNYSEADLLYAENQAAITVDTAPKYRLEVNISTFAATTAQVGFLMVGNASTALTVTVKFFFMNNQVGPTLQQYCPAAGYYTISAPFVLTSIQGQASIQVQVYTNTGTFTVPAASMQIYVYARNLLGGITGEYPHAEVEHSTTIVNNVIGPSVQGSAAVQVPILQNALEDATIVENTLDVGTEISIQVNDA